MHRCRRLETPTFAQTVRLIQTLPAGQWTDMEAIIEHHLAMGFRYQKDQISRAIAALTDHARPWDQSNRPSARST